MIARYVLPCALIVGAVGCGSYSTPSASAPAPTPPVVSASTPPSTAAAANRPAQTPGLTAPSLQKETDDPQPGQEKDEVTTIEKLVATLPEDSIPRTFGDTVRTDRANQWSYKQWRGKRVEDIEVLTSIHVERTLKPMRYDVSFGVEAYKKKSLTVGGLRYDLAVTNFSSPAAGAGLALKDVDEKTADAFTGLQGKRAKIAGKIESAYFLENKIRVVLSGLAVTEDMTNPDPAPAKKKGKAGAP